MGVTNLWQVLQPVQKQSALASLKGQTLAVDLSIWVCENQCVKQMQGIVTRPYLRNLYFRISCLLQLGIHLVFAIDGEAPELKHDTMSRRQEVQYKGKKQPAKPKKPGRSRFNAKVRECCEMLDCLGVPYIQSKGEAEALCGLLNAAGIVDGCITNDGDVFLYGAKTVYRNFSIASKDPSVESYSMVDIEDQLNMDREKMVALALLVGCDYVPKGIPGVGIEKASKLLMSYQDIIPLQRLKNWKTLADSDCLDSLEQQIKRKAINVPEFPQQKIIDEFLIPKDPLPSKQLRWRRPKLGHLQTFSLTKMEWPEEYTHEKVLPLITLWDMTDIKNGGTNYHLTPHRIVKARVRNGVPSLEVEWQKQNDDKIFQAEHYVTIEDRHLFSQCFQQLVIEFDEEIALKKSKKRGGKKKKCIKDDAEENINEEKDFDILTEQLDQLNINDSEKTVPGHKPSCSGSNLSEELSSKIIQEDLDTKSSIAETGDLGYQENKFDNTNDFEISCEEENLSLRSRLMRKSNSNFTENARIIDLDSDDDDNYYNVKPIKSSVSLIPLQTLDHDAIPSLNSKDRNVGCTNFDTNTPEKVPNTGTFCSDQEFEETSVKIYNISDFSNLQKIDAELNTPSLSRIRNFSPSLYQTLLESTPTSASKLRKAALLNSILRSPLQVESILNMIRKTGENVSPVILEQKSGDRSLSNMSSVSMNGTIPGSFGNFQIESSLLKSIISSGGSIIDDQVKQPFYENSAKSSIEDSLASKLSFDISSPLVPCHEKCVSKQETEVVGAGFPVSINSKIEPDHLKKEISSCIDLTTDTPEHGDCKTTLDLSPHEHLINQHEKESTFNSPLVTSLCGEMPKRFETFSPKSALNFSIDPDDQAFESDVENEKIDNNKRTTNALSELDTRYCIKNNRTNSTDQVKEQNSGKTFATKPGNNTRTSVCSLVSSKEETFYQPSALYNASVNCSMDLLNAGIHTTNIDITTGSSYVEKSSPFKSCFTHTINNEKENETVISASQDMVFMNENLVNDDRSPVSLADRLRRKLNITSMKGVLQEVTRNNSC